MYMSSERRLPTRLAIIALMAVGSVALWIGDPLLWFWITARLQSTQPTMGPYALAIFGIVLTGVALGEGLSRVNRLYGHVPGSAPAVPVGVPWGRGLRG